MPDDDEFDENGQMDEFRITDQYYITFTDGSEIVLDFTVDGDLTEVYVPDEEERGTKSMATKHAEQYRKDGWDMDITALEELVNNPEKKKDGGDISTKTVYNVSYYTEDGEFIDETQINWATQLFKSGLLKTEAYIPKTLYYYRYIQKK